MSFEESLRDLAKVAIESRSHLLTEEAVKTAIILKMFHALEYDPFNPTEIVPEFTADVGIRKGEKVDYAIRIGGKISILIECKGPEQTLDLKHASQLYRYFSVTDARFAVLTNGYDWEFYTDLDEPNRMDKKPFLSFRLNDLDPTSVSELSKFRKGVFDEENILSTASNLKYVSALKALLRNEFDEPSDELVSLFGKKVYEGGRFTAQVHEQFAKLLKRSISEVLRDRVNARLSSALMNNLVETTDEQNVGEEIETTEEEWDGYRITTAIASKIADPCRIFIRDQKSYCGILFDNNNRKPIVRLWFNSKSTKYLGLFDGETEVKVPIQRPADIYKYSDRICATIERYLA